MDKEKNVNCEYKNIDINDISQLFNNFKNDVINSINKIEQNYNNRFKKLEDEIKIIKHNNSKEIIEPKNNLKEISYKNNNINHNNKLYKSQIINPINSPNICLNNEINKINNTNNEINKSSINLNDNIARINMSDTENDKDSLMDSYEDKNKNLHQNNKKESNKTFKKSYKKKKRGKYKKKLAKSEFEKSIKYYEFKDSDNNIWKFSLNKFNPKNNTCYYNCSDTTFQARGIIKFIIEENKLLVEYIKDEEFKVVNEHTIAYEDHSYTFKNLIKSDINNLDKNSIKKKLENFKYLKHFLRIYLYKHNNIGTSLYKLIDSFKTEYGDIDINLDLIPDNEKNLIIERYKKKHNIDDDKDIKLKDIINLKNLSITSINNIKYTNNVKINFSQQLKDFTINNKYIISKLIVKFQRKNKEYVTQAYCIMTPEMEQNLKDKNNIQFFCDVTYYCVPPNNNKYRLFIIISFNKEKYKSTLCNITMINTIIDIKNQQLT